AEGGGGARRALPAAGRAASARSGGGREAARGGGRESRLPRGRRRGPERRCRKGRDPAVGTPPAAIRPRGRRAATALRDVPGRGRNPARVFRVGPSSHRKNRDTGSGKARATRRGSRRVRVAPR